MKPNDMPIASIESWYGRIYREKDRLWLLIWLGGMLLAWGWNSLFLNAPALQKIEQGVLNTGIIAVLVILFSCIAGWAGGVGLHFLEQARSRVPYLVATFLLNIIRSVPQIVGILVGYILITLLLQSGVLQSNIMTMILIAATLSLFVFQELADLIQERIDHYRQLDFYNAMLVCGIPESQIVNREILLKNSLNHIYNKLISIFGMTVFLLCSIDFIVSIGLSTRVSGTNLPLTLGSLLAKIDSKQDVLAIGHTLTNPGYISNLFFEHLQGITIAFLIVFTLLCIYKISNGYAERHEL